MDVAYYLSELLGQLGEVSVPGLGYFAQIRIEGYYNAADSTFYPPKNKVQFDPQIIDDNDDTLAQYIAEKKNISLASSRYFTEKYINNLKREAIMKDVPLADLGFLFIEGSNITFKPADVMKNDPAVFGYSPLHLEKLEGPSFIHQMESYGQVTKETSPVPGPETEALKLTAPDPAYELPQTSQLTYEQEAQAMQSKPGSPAGSALRPMPELRNPQPATYQPETEQYIPPLKPEEQEEFVFHGKTYVSPERRSFKWMWVTLAIILGIFVVGVLGILGLHKFKPALYNQIRGVAPAPIVIKTPPHMDSLKTDTIKDTTNKASTVTTDTTTKAKPVAVKQEPLQSNAVLSIDSIKAGFEVIGSSARTLSEAEQTVKNFKSLNLDTYIITDKTTSPYKVSLGHYPTRAEANKKVNELKKSGIAKGAWPLKINPKQ